MFFFSKERADDGHDVLEVCWNEVGRFQTTQVVNLALHQGARTRSKCGAPQRERKTGPWKLTCHRLGYRARAFSSPSKKYLAPAVDLELAAS